MEYDKVMKFIVIGGKPQRSKVVPFTGLKCLGVTDSQDEALSIADKAEKECGGLIEVFNTETGQKII